MALTTEEQIDRLLDRLPFQRIKRLEAENAALRAEVGKLREALTHIDSIDPQERQMAGVSDHAARGLINAAGAIARDALHKGATNEPQE